MSQSLHSRGSCAGTNGSVRARETPDSEDLGYQKRTKRMMLQQLSRLFNQLSEQLTCLTEMEETGKGAEGGMRDWQEQFLEGQCT